MTLSTIAVVHRYKPGSAEAPEAIPFQYGSQDDLRVLRRSVLGIETALSRDVDYTLSGDGRAGIGRITAIGSFGADELIVVRASDMRQDVPLPPGQPIPSRAIERDALDRLSKVDQEQGEALGRTIAVRYGEDPGILPTAPGRALRLLQFDYAGRAGVIDPQDLGFDINSDFDGGVDGAEDGQFFNGGADG